MNTYISTCVSGATEVVKEIISASVSDVRFVLDLDGLIMYRSNLDPSIIKQIRGVNNSFLVVRSFKPGEVAAIEDLVNKGIRDFSIVKEIHEYYGKKRSRVRVMASVGNKTVALARPLLEKFESKLIQRSELKIDRRLAETEVWFVVRNEGMKFIGIRLTMSRVDEKDLQPGQLRPEIAHILCFLSHPNVDDIVLDPFAGAGGLIFERTNFKYKEILALDNKQELVDKLTLKAKKQNKKIRVFRGDALHLIEIENSSIDKIITDPPWGMFDTSLGDLKAFYEQMFVEFDRVLKQNGLVVLLSGQKEVVDELLRLKVDRFKLIRRYDILVSGKKSAIYVLSKR
jgi:tRNA G10  N-methylase Trm11